MWPYLKKLLVIIKRKKNLQILKHVCMDFVFIAISVYELSLTKLGGILTYQSMFVHESMPIPHNKSNDTFFSLQTFLILTLFKLNKRQCS